MHIAIFFFSVSDRQAAATKLMPWHLRAFQAKSVVWIPELQKPIPTSQVAKAGKRIITKITTTIIKHKMVTRFVILHKPTFPPRFPDMQKNKQSFCLPSTPPSTQNNYWQESDTLHAPTLAWGPKFKNNFHFLSLKWGSNEDSRQRWGFFPSAFTLMLFSMAS